jgi:predicted chitinase
MSKAREIAQVDIKNGITKIVNFTKDLNMNANVPTLEVSGSDQGIKHSFVVNTDAFATGNTDLINHKTYYYMVIAYSHNNYKQFSDFIGEDCVANPDLVATKYPLASAAFFFQKNKLWDICDKGATPEIVTAVTKRVNGGTHGLDDRLAKFNTFNSILA